MPDSIYLDNQSTTPTDPRVRAAMLPFLDSGSPGNPHSEHVLGRKAGEAIETARSQIAALIGARPSEIVFTSGATEANNLALQGAARGKRRRGNHLITCATEHRCVLETARFLGRIGFDVEVLPVERDGRIDVVQLDRAIKDDTFLVSIMAANNEIGVLQPLEEIGKICKAHDVIFHSDAAQAAGKIPLDVKATGVEMMSLSGHKLYAPIGVGALYVSDELPVELEPVIFGGGQERGLRSGTLSPHLCVGFGMACTIAATEQRADARAAAYLREAFLAVVTDCCPDVRINGSLTHRLPGNLSLTFPDVDADRLVGSLQPEIAISTNAACSSGVLRPSHVLGALGLSESEAASTVRIGFGRFNNLSEVEWAGRRLAEAAVRIRRSEKSGAAAE